MADPDEFPFNLSQLHGGLNPIENFDENKVINILLLGETGVGKSTFINAFVNYLTYETLEEAKIEDIISLIPTVFTITDRNTYDEKEVFFGQDKNEKNDPGQSCTQKCRCYVFPLKESELYIRLIDTPGVGDTRGLLQDRMNFDNILTVIGQFTVLHCICMLFKPNNAKITVSFEYCFKQLLCHLEKSAKDNIVFLFTNARSTFYSPGDTVKPLRKLLANINSTPPHVNIPFGRETIYCVDNEAFRFLVAIKNKVSFSDEEEINFSTSWNIAAKECIRLIDHIIGTDLKPHLIQNSLSVNEARRQILNLSQPSKDILQNIEDNLKVLNKHMDSIRNSAYNIEDLKKVLYIPHVSLEIKELRYPKTVCSSPTCCETYEVHGLTKRHYKKPCHEKCQLESENDLFNCKAINPFTGFCRVCPNWCWYKKHLHIYYDSKVVAKQKEDDSVKEKIRDEESAKTLAEKKIKEIRELCQKNREEFEMITKILAKFARFLKYNSIAPYNDSFESYLEHLIENLKINSRDNSYEKNRLKEMKTTLVNYKKEKDILDKAIKDVKCSDEVSAKDVFTLIEVLVNLPLNGEKIKESQNKFERAKKFEHLSFCQEFYYVPKKQSTPFSKRNWIKKILAK